MSEWMITLALGCAAALYIGQRALGGRAPYPLPPGPPGLPMVGSVIGIDTGAPWKTYAEWGRTYGDIVYFRLLGKDIVVLNSEKIAKDLLEKRSRNYSDRPYLITNELCGLGFVTPLMRYSDRWRSHRRFFQQTFRRDVAHRFWPVQQRKACHFLRQLFDTPEQLDDHVFEYTASIILNSVYDYDPTSRKDDVVKIVADALNIIVVASRFDIAIVADVFPLLLHLPSWFPGMSFKKEMAISRAFSRQYLDKLIKHSLQSELTHSTAPSMVRDALQRIEKQGASPEESWMELLKEAAGTAFLGGAETSTSTLMTFFLMMMLNPAVQVKAQAQIDAVVGMERLPTIDDRPLLPFIDAILWETFRCHPIAPLSLPHVSVDDDAYGGFYIPKGTILLPNVWSMAHDESMFPNPHEFIPERFLNDDGTLKPNEIEHIAFGFGRRSCVGKHFADTSLWAIITKVLAVFKVLKPLDENGVEVTVEPRFSSGLIIHPLPFKYRIVPRFPEMDAEKLERLIAARITP